MTREGGALSVQRGDLVAGRYRAGEPLGPAWRARDETSGTEVLLVPVTMPEASSSSADVLDTGRWHDRRGVLPVTGTATGDAGAWLVTEPIPARTLAGAVEQWGALPAEQVLLIAAATVTALSATGPRISAKAEHILLTDDGQVLLLPVETAENDDLFTLGTALFLAAEGHSPLDPATEAPHQPTLAAMIRGLMQKDPDRPATLDRTFAELSRLGAPLEAEHGADTLHEAQAASAAAAEEEEDEPDDTPLFASAEAADDEEDADATHVSASEVPTQPMSAAELLAETGESDAVPAEEESDADSESTRQVPTISADADADVAATMDTAMDTAMDIDADADGDADTDGDGDGESTKQVPLVAAAADDEVTQQVSSLDGLDTAATHLDVPASDADDKPTRQVSALAAADSDADKPTRQVPALAAADSADEKTQQVPSLSTDTSSDPDLGLDPDTSATRPVPIVEVPAAADAIPTDSTQEISSPDDSATKTLPIPSGAPAEPSATRAEPLPAETNPFVAPQAAGLVPPTQAAAVVPPTQAADAVPPQAVAPSQPMGPPQPIVPPTQAAAAVPPPGAASPNPWLQPPPQIQPQPQPHQGTWQQGAPAPQPQPGGWGPAPGQPLGQVPPGQPPFPPGQPPYFPQQGPPPTKGNGGKTAAIIIGAVVAVAAVVSLVVLTTRSNGGSSDNVGNAAHSSSSTTSSASASTQTSVPGTNFPTDSATASSSDSSSPSDTSSDTAGGGATDTGSASDSASPPDLTSTPFDPNSLNAMQTDKTPLDLNALVPQEFTDDKGVHYTLKAGSVQPCVQTDMSSNMQDILTSNSCSKEIAASFVDDSGQYLVSVKVLPLPDQHTATTVYNDLSKESAADFGIWCPGSGPGSNTCQGDYQSATIKQYREQQHRYIILSVALAVNHSQSTEIAPWLDAAAKKAVDGAGPLNWSGNQ